MILPSLEVPGGYLNGLTDADVSGAATDIPAHGLFDVGVGRLRCVLKQRHGAHYLSALAVATLNDVFTDPRILNYAANRILTHRFDGHDRAFPDQ